MLHFAYGSNMSREAMRRRCPDAEPVGSAVLRGYRLFIMASGYASVMPSFSAVVHGILWRVSPRDLAALDAYENVSGGLYTRAQIAVIHDGRSVPALVYVGAERREGSPRKGYMELVLRAARDNGLPPEYIASLEQVASGRFNRASGTGDRI